MKNPSILRVFPTTPRAINERRLGRVPSSAQCCSNVGFAASIPRTRTFVGGIGIDIKIFVEHKPRVEYKGDTASLLVHEVTGDASPRPSSSYLPSDGGRRWRCRHLRCWSGTELARPMVDRARGFGEAPPLRRSRSLGTWTPTTACPHATRRLGSPET